MWNVWLTFGRVSGAMAVLMLVLAASCSFSMAQNRKIESWRLEVRGNSFFPLKRQVGYTSGYGGEITNKETVWPQYSGGGEIVVSTDMFEWSLPNTNWYFSLNIGLGTGIAMFKSNVEAFGSCPRCTFYVPPSTRKLNTTSIWLNTFVDNSAVISHKGEKLFVQLGLNIRTAYFFYNRASYTGSTTRLDNGESNPVSESGADWWNPVESVQYFYRWNYMAQALLNLRPFALKGFYFTIRLPFHPIDRASILPTTYYGVSFGLGYKFTKN